MSKGRKSQKASVTASDRVNRTDLLGNLTQEGGRKDLISETRTFTKNSGPSSSRSQKRRDARSVSRQRDEFRAETVQLDQDQVDNLNIRFKERAQDVLRRNTFQGREQLVLTNRT